MVWPGSSSCSSYLSPTGPPFFSYAGVVDNVSDRLSSPFNPDVSPLIVGGFHHWISVSTPAPSRVFLSLVRWIRNLRPGDILLPIRISMVIRTFIPITPSRELSCPVFSGTLFANNVSITS